MTLNCGRLLLLPEMAGGRNAFILGCCFKRILLSISQNLDNSLFQERAPICSVSWTRFIYGLSAGPLNVRKCCQEIWSSRKCPPHLRWRRLLRVMTYCPHHLSGTFENVFYLEILKTCCTKFKNIVRVTWYCLHLKYIPTRTVSIILCHFLPEKGSLFSITPCPKQNDCKGIKI